MPERTCPSAGRGFELDSRSPSYVGDPECPICGAPLEIEIDACGDGEERCTECDYQNEIYGPTGD